MKIKLSVNQNLSNVSFEQYLKECEAQGYKVVRKNNKECSLQELHDSFIQKGDEKK